jgi:hypothetical protein
MYIQYGRKVTIIHNSLFVLLLYLITSATVLSAYGRSCIGSHQLISSLDVAKVCSGCNCNSGPVTVPCTQTDQRDGTRDVPTGQTVTRQSAG